MELEDRVVKEEAALDTMMESLKVRGCTLTLSNPLSKRLELSA